MKNRGAPLSALALLCIWCPLPVHAETELAGRVTVGTDYVFRGVSQTMSRAAVQGELGIEHSSGLYGFLWASNVRFTAADEPSDGADVEIDIGAGMAHAVSDRVVVDLGATRYTFPGTRPGIDYDYVEWLGAIEIDGTHRLTIGYSDNVLASGGIGVYYALQSGISLPRETWLSAEVGHYDLENAYGISYQYLELGLEGTVSTLDWRVSYFLTSSHATELFYETTVNDRFLLTLSLPF